MHEGMFRDKVVHVWDRSLAVAGPVAWPSGMLARARDLADLVGWAPSVEEARARVGRLGPVARALVLERISDARDVGVEVLDFSDVDKWIPMAHDAALGRRWMPPAVLALGCHAGTTPRPRVGPIEFPDVEELVESFVRSRWFVIRERGVAHRIP